VDCYAARTDSDGALVRGRPSVEGCEGAGAEVSSSRCALARDPTVIVRDPVTRAAPLTASTPASATAAMVATSAVCDVPWLTASTIVSAVSRRPRRWMTVLT
jgi:hypothetical protein